MPSCREGPAGAGTGTRRGPAPPRPRHTKEGAGGAPRAPALRERPALLPALLLSPRARPALRAPPRSSLPGPPTASAFVVRLGCRARGSRVRAVAPRDLGQRDPTRARAGAQDRGLYALPNRPRRVPHVSGPHRRGALSPRGGAAVQATHLDAEDSRPQKQRRPSAST